MRLGISRRKKIDLVSEPGNELSSGPKPWILALGFFFMSLVPELLWARDLADSDVEQPLLQRSIFNEKLIKEIKERYSEKFVQPDAQLVSGEINKHILRYEPVDYLGSAQQAAIERNRFGEFIIRRLAEWHLDNYAKHEPKMRPVYQARDRLNQVSLKVSRLKVAVHYSLSSNSADVDFINPWLESKVTLRLNSPIIRIGRLNEATVTLKKKLSETMSVEGNCTVLDGVVTIIGHKAIAPNLGSMVSASTFFRENGYSRRESIYLSGVSYSF
jgi:hypothetical protein